MKALVAEGIPPVRFPDLRHSCRVARRRRCSPARKRERAMRSHEFLPSFCPNCAHQYSVEVYFTSGAPNRAFAGYVATLPRAIRENVDAMLALVHLCQRPTLTLADGARLLQVSEVEAKDRLDALGTGTDALIERDGDARRGMRWRLRPPVATALGTAVQHRARADSARPRVEAHLKEYGWITNKTIRNMFDLDIQQANQILNELRAVNVVVKDPDGPQRGPSIRWLPAKPTKGDEKS